MFGEILLGTVVILVVFGVIVARRPSAFHIERSTSVLAAPDLVFAQLNDFQAWAAWSPWEKLESKDGKDAFGGQGGRGCGVLVEQRKPQGGSGAHDD